MKTKGGKEIAVIGEIGIDNQNYKIVKLTTATYINETLVRYILIPQSDLERSDTSNDIQGT